MRIIKKKIDITLEICFIKSSIEHDRKLSTFFLIKHIDLVLADII